MSKIKSVRKSKLSEKERKGFKKFYNKRTKPSNSSNPGGPRAFGVNGQQNANDQAEKALREAERKLINYFAYTSNEDTEDIIGQAFHVHKLPEHIHVLSLLDDKDNPKMEGKERKETLNDLRAKALNFYVDDMNDRTSAVLELDDYGDEYNRWRENIRDECYSCWEGPSRKGRKPSKSNVKGYKWEANSRKIHVIWDKPIGLEFRTQDVSGNPKKIERQIENKTRGYIELRDVNVTENHGRNERTIINIPFVPDFKKHFVSAGTVYKDVGGKAYRNKGPYHRFINDIEKVLSKYSDAPIEHNRMLEGSLTHKTRETGGIKRPWN